MPDSAVLAEVRGTMKGDDVHAQSSCVAALAGHRAILGSPKPICLPGRVADDEIIAEGSNDFPPRSSAPPIFVPMSCHSNFGRPQSQFGASSKRPIVST